MINRDPDARGPERIDFHCLIYVTSSRYAHMVDFETQGMSAGAFRAEQQGQGPET